MRHVIAGKFSAKLHGRSKCHIWIQFGPYIIILAFLTYVHNMFHLHPRKLNEEVVSNAMLRSARNPVECVFGRLKSRWQVLTKKNGFQT